MIRAVPAVMAGLLCGLCGLRYATALRGEATRLSRWSALLASLALILSERRLSLPDAMLAAADSNAPADTLLRQVAQAMQTSPMTQPEEAFDHLAISGAERGLLQRLFCRLGRGTLDSRLLALEQARAELDHLAMQAAQRAEKDARLWQTLGWTGGACLTLLLL